MTIRKGKMSNPAVFKIGDLGGRIFPDGTVNLELSYKVPFDLKITDTDKIGCHLNDITSCSVSQGKKGGLQIFAWDGDKGEPVYIIIKDGKVTLQRRNKKLGFLEY